MEFLSRSEIFDAEASVYIDAPAAETADPYAAIFALATLMRTYWDIPFPWRDWRVETMAGLLCKRACTFGGNIIPNIERLERRLVHEQTPYRLLGTQVRGQILSAALRQASDYALKPA